MVYRLINLATPSSRTSLQTPACLNEIGEAGGSWPAEDGKTVIGLLWDAHGAEQMRIENAHFACFVARNSHAEAVANVIAAPSDPYHLEVLAGGELRSLRDKFAGHQTYAFAMNDHGWIAGLTRPALKDRAFILDIRAAAAAPILLELLPGSDESQAISIANNGDVIGTCGSGEAQRACLWSGGKVLDLGSYAPSAVNENRQIAATRIVGGVSRAGILDYSAALPVWHELPLLPGFSQSLAYDVSNKGHVVGYSFGAELSAPGFIYDGTMRPLSGLIPADTGGYYYPFCTNDRGDITAIRNGLPALLSADYLIDTHTVLYGELLKVVLIGREGDAPKWGVKGVHVNLPNGTVINFPPLPIPGVSPPGPTDLHLTPAQEQVLLAIAIERIAELSNQAQTRDVLAHAAAALLKLAAHR
jgi:hypothetical protein